MGKDLDQNVMTPARGRQTDTAHFDGNRDGFHGGLPKARDPEAAGVKPMTSHPPSDRKSGPYTFAPTRA